MVHATASPGSAAASAQKWWTRPIGTYAYAQRADPSEPGYVGDVLFVFVHGITGDAITTWGNTAEILLRSAGIAADCFTFDYPAGFSEPGNAEQAAADLRTVLDESFHAYRHI